MIKISLKGLAKFMTGNAAQQRKILRDFKYPDPEGSAQAVYYREARDFILAYHKHDHDLQWLLERSKNLTNMAMQAGGQTRVRCQHNARALQLYARNFGEKKFKVLPDKKLFLKYGNIYVSVVPDLHVLESGKEKIIKFEFSKDSPDEKVARVITQAMFEAQSEAGMGLKGSSVLYVDVNAGTIYKGARAGSRMRTEIEAACANIAAIWDGI